MDALGEIVSTAVKEAAAEMEAPTGDAVPKSDAVAAARVEVGCIDAEEWSEVAADDVI